MSLNDEGYQYYRQSRFNAAEGKFSQALKLNRLIDRREGIAANLNNLGVIAQEQGDAGAGHGLLSGGPGDQPGHWTTPPGLSETLNNLGPVYLSQGKVKEARKAYLEALD